MSHSSSLNFKIIATLKLCNLVTVIRKYAPNFDSQNQQWTFTLRFLIISSPNNYCTYMYADVCWQWCTIYVVISYKIKAMICKLGLCALFMKSHFLIWKTNFSTKLQKISSLYSETSFLSYYIFRPTLNNLVNLQKLGFICDWLAVCYWTWQITFLSFNSFWRMSQNKKNSLPKLLKTGSLCFEDSLASYEKR